eukprot:Gregarina_sp_Poly_1__10782@NODE_828_length_6111_cov_65_604897_g599_i0_p3_GENE_NODE_828_length_6111_cov_65_604897_g599_i0NODE_828_length_6111_cov_65_604897_g599_i0_p3_ORF_typecomplete_len190_score23_14_NODE_828_length_6111_cov_65_604897_g599_i058627
MMKRREEGQTRANLNEKRRFVQTQQVREESVRNEAPLPVVQRTSVVRPRNITSAGKSPHVVEASEKKQMRIPYVIESPDGVETTIFRVGSPTHGSDARSLFEWPSTVDPINWVRAGHPAFGPSDEEISTVRSRLEELAAEVKQCSLAKTPCNKNLLKKFLRCFFWPPIEPLKSTDKITVTAYSDTRENH